jgi:Nif-specific regulatory protein
VEKGTFREDLLYRLNTIAITLPPLRQRTGDVPLLANHFLEKYAVGRRAHIRGFTSAAIAALERYHWPGNVRELENTVERAVVLAAGDLIEPGDLRLPEAARVEAIETGTTLKDAERRLVLRTLEEHGGNVSETARVLGISRRALHYKLKEWESPAP